MGRGSEKFLVTDFMITNHVWARKMCKSIIHHKDRDQNVFLLDENLCMNVQKRVDNAFS